MIGDYLATQGRLRGGEPELKPGRARGVGDAIQKLKSSEDLRKAVVEAYELLHQAHAGYHEALAIIADTDHSPDGALAFQHARTGVRLCCQALF